MKKPKFIVLLASAAFFMASCTSSPDNINTTEGNWVSMSTLQGSGRAFGVSFTIGNYAYVGSGKNANTADTSLSDFYRYDPVSGLWTQVSSIPVARYMGVAFTVNGKGYVGSGIVDRPTTQVLSDFYEYDPTADKWTRKADIPAARYRATAFAIGDTGYVLCGMAPDRSTFLKDMYDYNPASDTWTEDAFAGNKRFGGTAFVLNGQGYVLGGTGSDGQLCNDFYRFTPGASSNRWYQLRHITNFTDSAFDDNYSSIARTDGVSLVMGKDVYLAVGTSAQAPGSQDITAAASGINNTWHWNVSNDTWDERSAAERANRDGAVGFVINNQGYVATGGSGSAYYDALDEWFPTQDLNTND